MIFENKKFILHFDLGRLKFQYKLMIASLSLLHFDTNTYIFSTIQPGSWSHLPVLPDKWTFFYCSPYLLAAYNSDHVYHSSAVNRGFPALLPQRSAVYMVCSRISLKFLNIWVINSTGSFVLNKRVKWSVFEI